VHAHLGRPELYDLADEMGLLVWQDFPLQWGYTDLPAFREEALRQAEDMIRQYGNHPSIAVWCMHNESPHAMTWMQHRAPDQNLALDDALADLAKRLDPSRVIHRDSGTGDGHYYYGWYDGKLGDVADAKVVPFVTEYGAAALPDVETLRTIFDEATLWPGEKGPWDAWQFADFQPKNTFSLAHVKRGRDIAEFVKNSQRYQAITVRYTTELLRRRKWAEKSPSTGVFQFMFTDDWPAITWSVVDYYRRPKAGYEALKDAMRRVLPSIAYDPHDAKKPVAIDVVNDLVTPMPGAHVAWRVMQGERAVLSGERALDVPADGVVHVADLGVIAGLGGPAGGKARLDVTLDDAGGKRIAESHLGPDDFLEPSAQPQ
jgi:beta-mannosidase